MKQKTCAEVAAEYVDNLKKIGFDKNEWSVLFLQCSDFPRPKKKKQVWQWRYKYIDNGNFWITDEILRTKEQAKDNYNTSAVKYEIHAGPFEVDE